MGQLTGQVAIPSSFSISSSRSKVSLASRSSLLINVKIKLFVVDCDGVLSDGKIYISSENITQKAYSVIDGEGIALLHDYGIKILVITKEKSDIDGLRCKKLCIDEVSIGIRDKWRELEKICKRKCIDVNNVAYMGDDISDLIAMKNVGLSFAPANAQEIIKDNAMVCLEHEGGNGAVREAVNYIIKNGMY